MRWWQKIAEKWRAWDARRGYTCDFCGAEIFEYPTHRLCSECERKLVQNENNRACVKCGRKTVAMGVCLDCKQHLPAFTRGVSPLVYEGETCALINRLKNGNRRLAWYLGEEMTKALSPLLSEINRGDEEILLIPVPTSQESLRERGYNQAQALAAAVEKTLLKSGVNALLDCEILQKSRSTKKQKHLGFAERTENVAGAYHVHKRKACKGKTCVLIDDIMTTGATGNECAQRLLGAGAKTVVFLVGAALAEQVQKE